ncbi:hypothetical protein [Streptomyces sp. NPDC056361]|uniref:hypothetical protein n=1 Tax=Streptomyces sp. NPDC056361 TaxID=3345795 RepID=UPI0035DCED1E
MESGRAEELLGVVSADGASGAGVVLGSPDSGLDAGQGPRTLFLLLLDVEPGKVLGVLFSRETPGGKGGVLPDAGCRDAPGELGLGCRVAAVFVVRGHRA